jgi:hypothetical protein
LHWLQRVRTADIKAKALMLDKRETLKNKIEKNGTRGPSKRTILGQEPRELGLIFLIMVEVSKSLITLLSASLFRYL